MHNTAATPSLSLLSRPQAVRAARNAGVPFVELPTLSPERLAEAWESLTGRPAPGLRRLRWQHQQREQRQRDAMAGVEYLPPLHDPECEGSARALSLLTGGQVRRGGVHGD